MAIKASLYNCASQVWDVLNKEISPRKAGSVASLLAMLSGSGCATIYNSNANIDPKTGEIISAVFENRPYIIDTQYPDICRFVVGPKKDGVQPTLIDKCPKGLSSNDIFLFEDSKGHDIGKAGFANGQYRVYIREGTDGAKSDIIKTFFLE